MLQKEKIASLRGGSSAGGKKCGCVCFGPIEETTPPLPLQILMEETEAKQTPPIRVAPIVEHKMRIAF